MKFFGKESVKIVSSSCKAKTWNFNTICVQKTEKNNSTRFLSAMTRKAESGDKVTNRTIYKKVRSLCLNNRLSMYRQV